MKTCVCSKSQDTSSYSNPHILLNIYIWHIMSQWWLWLSTVTTSSLLDAFFRNVGIFTLHTRYNDDHFLFRFPRSFIGKNYKDINDWTITTLHSLCVFFLCFKVLIIYFVIIRRPCLNCFVFHWNYSPFYTWLYWNHYDLDS